MCGRTSVSRSKHPLSHHIPHGRWVLTIWLSSFYYEIPWLVNDDVVPLAWGVQGKWFYSCVTICAFPVRTSLLRVSLCLKSMRLRGKTCMLAIARDKVPYVIKICYPGTKCAHCTDRWDFQYRTLRYSINRFWSWTIFSMLQQASAEHRFNAIQKLSPNLL